MKKDELTNETPADAKPVLAVRALTNTQLAVYACLKNWGAEIQVDR